MLDSSPVALPPISSRRPLKRSASVASLPTPPRTRHRRKRPLGGSQYDSDSDRSDTASESEEDEGVFGKKGSDVESSKFKKRRTSGAEAEKEEEDAFWMGSSKTKTKDQAKDEKELKRPQAVTRTSSFAAPPLLYRRTTTTTGAAAASSSTTGQAPVSPPPSNRRPQAGASGSLLAARPIKPLPGRQSAPRTPPPKKKGPVRDSPNNPFLVSPTLDVPASPSDFSSTDASPGSPMRRVNPIDEKPMITMVFRGQRGQIPNPYYNHRENRAKSPSRESRLPIEHVDYSPSAQCPPKILFPQARRHHRKVSSSSKHRSLNKELGRDSELGHVLTSNRDGRKGRLGHARSSSIVYDSDAEEDQSDGEGFSKIKPMKLDFARAVSPDRKAEGGLAGVRVPPLPVPPADL